MNLVLDGANIARQGVDSSGDGSQLRAALDRLLADGHTVYPVIAQFRMSGKRAFPNMEWVNEYREHPSVHFVQAPSGTDDDAFILDLAIQLKGVIVSNDLFRDHKERLGKDSVRYCGSKATHRMMYSIAGDLFLPDPKFKMPVEEAVEVLTPAVEATTPVKKNESPKQASSSSSKRRSSNRQSDKKNHSHRISSASVRSSILQHADLPMPVQKLSTYLPKMIEKATGRKMTKAEIRSEAGFGNRSWIEIFSGMSPELIIDRSGEVPIVKAGTTRSKKKSSSSNRRRRGSDRKETNDSENDLERNRNALKIVFKEIIDDGRYRLVSEGWAAISRFLPWMKVEERMILSWSQVCQKYLKRTNIRLARMDSSAFFQLLSSIPWPLGDGTDKIIRHRIDENELILWRG